jgi:hypothetical protein
MASSIAQTATSSGYLKELKIVCTFDGSDGSFTSVKIREMEGFLFTVITDPDGVTAPTDQYDITLTDSRGLDVMGGALANRSNTTTEMTYPILNSNYTSIPVKDQLTLNITNNSVNSAIVTIVIYYGGII